MLKYYYVIFKHTSKTKAFLQRLWFDMHENFVDLGQKDSGNLYNDFWKMTLRVFERK